MLSFIAAVYNEEAEIIDLLNSVEPFVDHLCIADDGSTDRTIDLIRAYRREVTWVNLKQLEHIGLPETVKNEALKMVLDGSWVLMLDADERFAPGVLDQIRVWVNDGMNVHGISDEITHVYFRQIEIIDNIPVREFRKAKLFKKDAIMFPLNNIHADDQFRGDGLFKEEWVVLHRKTSNKQIQREQEYLETYDKLLEDGKIDEGRHQWLRGLHHFVK